MCHIVYETWNKDSLDRREVIQNQPAITQRVVRGYEIQDASLSYACEVYRRCTRLTGPIEDTDGPGKVELAYRYTVYSCDL